jgi:hypothetical protein
MNTCGFNINCCQGSGGGSTPVIPSNYLYNVSNIGATTNGRFPMFDGSNLGETLVSSQLQQTNLGITITNDLNVSNITTANITDLNTTIDNISQVIYNLTSINTKV